MVHPQGIVSGGREQAFRLRSGQILLQVDAGARDVRTPKLCTC